MVENIWLMSALWVGLALMATLISIRLAVSVTLIEIMVGALGGNLLGLAPNEWVNYLAGMGAILLTFLAGAETATRDRGEDAQCLARFFSPTTVRKGPPAP